MKPEEPGDCKGSYDDSDVNCTTHCLIRDECIVLTKEGNPVNTKGIPLDFEVECVDATGIEESFDEGLTYVAEPHTDPNMIFVYDRNGQERECFRERFKRVRTMTPNTIKFREPKPGDKLRIIGEPKMYFKHKLE